MRPGSSATSAESSCRWMSLCARSAETCCRQRLHRHHKRQQLRCLRHLFHRQPQHRCLRFRAPLSLRNRVEAKQIAQVVAQLGKQSRSLRPKSQKKLLHHSPNFPIRPNKIQRLQRRSRALENPPNSSQKGSPTESARNPAKSTTTEPPICPRYLVNSPSTQTSA